MFYTNFCHLILRTLPPQGIDEFKTDKENLEAYLRILGKDTPQFAYEVAPKVSLALF